MKRRKFLKLGAVGLGAAGLFSGLYAWQIEPFWLEFVELHMPIKNLPNALRGKTLMQISDMHVGNRFDRSYLIDSLQKAQEYNPDFVVYTGDFVSYESEEQFDQLKEVLQSAVHGKIATLAILGNHDYGHNWMMPDVADEITTILEDRKIRVLRNSKFKVEGLTVFGLDDYWGTNFHPEFVMPDFKSSEANVLLCHNPDVMDQDVWQGYDSWVLSGHTHGGQVKPPFLSPPMLPVKNQRYTSGTFDFDDGRKLYINRALGHLWQVRFNVRPEITIFNLKSA